MFTDAVTCALLPLEPFKTCFFVQIVNKAAKTVQKIDLYEKCLNCFDGYKYNNLKKNNFTFDDDIII